MRKTKDTVIKKVVPVMVFILFAVLAVIGTLYDREISEAVYRPADTMSVAFTAAGIYLFFGLFVFYTGCLVRFAFHPKLKNRGKISCEMCFIGAVAASIIGSYTLSEKSCLGSYIHLEQGSGPVALMAFTAVFPLFIAGIILAGKRYDPDAVREITGILLFMTVVFLVQILIKQIFVRPRFYLMHMSGLDVGFEPWYKISADPTELINRYDLQKSDFTSFPSGHSMNAIAGVLALPVLAYAVPWMKKCGIVLKVIAVLITPCIMLSRIVLGAHYLSDVAFGAMIGIVLCFGYSLIMDYIRDPFRVAKINQKAEDERIQAEKEREEEYKFWEDC